MAKKKTRRVRQPQNQPTPATVPEKSQEIPATRGRDFDAMLREEYAYVIKDLRLIFLIAALMFALLIVLNLVL